jgi:hypothetical protein
MDTALVVASISAVVALASAGFSGWTQLHVTRRERQSKERANIDELVQRYLTPLRYYAQALNHRLEEIERKLQDPEREKEMRDWFKHIKDQVTQDSKDNNYRAWCYYVGIFSVSTLYYTCSYFYYAREVRFRRPFAESRPSYSKDLDVCLMGVTESFSGIDGIWDISQEVIGERFTSNGSAMTYAQMCIEHEADESFRRAPFFRPVDFYWKDLRIKQMLQIKDSLDKLVVFLDQNNPQAYDRHH